MNKKRVLVSISFVLLIATLLTFFNSIFLNNKLVLSLVLLINGLLLLYSTAFIINTHRAQLLALAGLFTLLGIIPLIVGFKLLPVFFSLNIPLLLYQTMAFLTTFFLLYFLLRKTA